MAQSVPPILPASGGTSIDDLLLNALYAHNKGLYAEAINFYSNILNCNPAASIASIIYKHRGMAYFAKSQYDEAIADFSRALELEPSAYKQLYFRGVIKSVQNRYVEAIDDFSQSLELHPYQQYCLYRRAQAYYHLEDYPAALADCEAALALGDEFEPGEKLRALLLDKLKM
jgi:putative GTP pyrophosphokinase